jgi:tetratricopeptide (TPR) repeat protein
VAICVYACTPQGDPSSSPKMLSDATVTEPSAVSRVENMPRSALGGYLAGHHARTAFDPEAAAEFFSRTLYSDPDNPQLLHEVLIAQIAQGKLEESLDVAHRLARQRSSEPLALLILAADSVKEQRFAEAGQYLAKFPQSGFYPFVKSLLSAWTMAGEGDTAGALNELEFLNSSPNFAPTHDYHAALIADVLQKETRARSAYTSALSAARQPSIRSVIAAGSFYERHGNAEVARQLYSSFPETGPEQTILNQVLLNLATGIPAKKLVNTPTQGFAEALYEISASLFRERAYEPSLIYCQTALFLRPELDVAHMQLADIYAEMGNYDLAVRAFQAIPSSSPYAWSARIRMADSLNESGNTEEASKELRSLALQQPERVDPLIALADMLRLKEQYKDAIVVYDEAIARIQPVEKQHWTIFYARGISLERSGDWEQAESDFLQALHLQPDQPLVLNYLGYSWVEQGTKLTEAKSMIQRAVAQRPNDGYIVDSLGWALYRLEEFDAALVHLERAVELRPDDSVINDHYGDALWAAGRHSEAKFQWLRALSLSPGTELRESVQKKLERPNPKKSVQATSKS